MKTTTPENLSSFRRVGLSIIGITWLIATAASLPAQSVRDALHSEGNRTRSGGAALQRQLNEDIAADKARHAAEAKAAAHAAKAKAAADAKIKNAGFPVKGAIYPFV